MKRKSLGFESMEQRTVLSASAIVAVEHIAAADLPVEHTAVPQQIQSATEGGGHAIRVMPGDFNFDGTVNDIDIDMLCRGMNLASVDNIYDLTADGAVDGADMDMLVRQIIGTEYGDANLDGEIDQVDSTMLFQNIFTETSGWASGDFSCDGVVDGLDFVLWNGYKFTETKLGGHTGAPAPSTVDLETEMTPIETASAISTPDEVTTATSISVKSAAAPVVTETVVENVAAVQTADPVAFAPTANQNDKIKHTYEQYKGDVTFATGDIADQSSTRLRFASLRRSFS